MFDDILVAVDGSEHGLHAAKLAGDLARAVKAQHLRIITVYDPIPSTLGEPNLSRTIGARLQETQAIFDETLKQVGESPAEIHTEMIEGQTAEKIVEVASIRNSDLIVMGSRGRSGLAGVLLGSNSQKVVSQAPCPVLIVR
ncbi:MAG: universal stress protein [Anaerolineales bacterium]|nr:universal stress protein [Anaerolineales bacterium]